MSVGEIDANVLTTHLKGNLVISNLKE